jgi:hypothetical protein
VFEEPNCSSPIWSLFRGPAAVKFDPVMPPIDKENGGMATTSATFSERQRPRQIADVAALVRAGKAELQVTPPDCVESKCSVVGVDSEACLQPLLRASVEYHEACAAEWIKICRNQSATVDILKN